MWVSPQRSRAMTATERPTRFPEHVYTADVNGLLRLARYGNKEVLPILADALEEAGYDDAADLGAIRAGLFQTTAEGEEVVTVARDGANTANVKGVLFAIWVTGIYRAVRRKPDGALTWRRVGSHGETAAGNHVTGAMADRARAFAESTGRVYVNKIRHGDRCD